MAKLVNLFVLTLLLVSTLSFAARSGPAFPHDSPAKIQAEGVETELNNDAVEDRCEGVVQEECLMRRTVAAHIDYIYTQKQNP
ncbi:phytosulfokines 3-like [Durio zibethinus]|uniref:Phytosulfokine n=1 Tax=Durio zibethinus TaxID=66656 RepID=A0A6P5ZHY6_DURZI|nr:phytosulfokines 3-like [Durio zibethinus]